MQLQVCWISLNSFFTKYPYINEGNGRVWKRPQKNCFLLFFYYWCLISSSFLDRKRKFEKFGPRWTTQATCYSKEEILWMRGSSNPTSEWSQKIIFRFKHNLTSVSCSTEKIRYWASRPPTENFWWITLSMLSSNKRWFDSQRHSQQ